MNDEITIREEGNFTEQFVCNKSGDKYVCAYIDNGQSRHTCMFEISHAEMETIIRGCIGYFPKNKLFLDIIVNSSIFSELVVRMGIACNNN